MSAQAVLFDAPGPKARQRHLILTIVGVVIVAGVLAAVLYQLGTKGQLDAAKWMPFLTASAWRNYLLQGLLGTAIAAVLSVILAGLLGLLLGIGRLASTRWIRVVSGVVVEFFRAVPVLIMMIFLFNALQLLRWFRNDVNPLMAVVVALTLYNGSVIAELVRSGVHSLPKGQAEAGLSIGLTPSQTLRSIQLPQALVAMLPALIGQLVVVVKDSALGYQITYSELLTWSKTLGSAYANTVPAYIVAAALFILINWSLTRFARWVEQRLRKRSVTAAPLTTAAPNIIQGSAEPGGPTDTLIDQR
ncbi:amino acid ABC transporter permease [Micropruina sp.]|uniref:amino acid ABC transporter permease n=1 Tax=Micropruina sp. TaxID=2737536 RepID=UPI0026322F0B|nr:amino acid ABC transporter permease [Micropruina sp.]